MRVVVKLNHASVILARLLIRNHSGPASLPYFYLIRIWSEMGYDHDFVNYPFTCVPLLGPDGSHSIPSYLPICAPPPYHPLARVSFDILNPHNISRTHSIVPVVFEWEAGTSSTSLRPTASRHATPYLTHIPNHCSDSDLSATLTASPPTPANPSQAPPP